MCKGAWQGANEKGIIEEAILSSYGKTITVKWRQDAETYPSTTTWTRKKMRIADSFYSHSIVPGGFEVMS